VNLDLARAYAMSSKDSAAVNLLSAAEQLSPQLIRYDQPDPGPPTELLRREHRPSIPELRPLACRASDEEPGLDLFPAGSLLGRRQSLVPVGVHTGQEPPLRGTGVWGGEPCPTRRCA